MPMYYAAERFSANKLLINCCRHMLMNYKHIDDESMCTCRVYVFMQLT